MFRLFYLKWIRHQEKHCEHRQIKHVKNELLKYTSDESLKDNVRGIPDTWEILQQINGYLFEWNVDDHRHGRTDIGVIAQEVEDVLPFLVYERPDGKLAVKYQSLIPLLIDAVKSLKQDVEELKGEIDGRTKGQ